MHIFCVYNSVKLCVVDGFAELDAGELGIAFVLCGRKAVGVTEAWNTRLAELTSHTLPQLERAFTAAMKYLLCC